MKKTKRITLIVLKGLAVLMLIYLLFDPVLKIKRTRTEKPIVVVAQDNSASIKENAAYKEQLKRLVKELGKDYDLKLTTFGSKTTAINADEIDSKVDFTDYCTDISQTIDDIVDKYSNQNLSAAVLLTDGIANQGSNVLNACDNLHFPVLTVALGDTTLWRDVFVAETRYNRVVYKDNDFPLEIVIGATKAKGSQSVVSVVKDGKTIYDKAFNIGEDNFSQAFSLVVNADKVGVQRFVINVKAIDTEKNITNNHREIFVEVMDGREKVLILAASPHPDVSALKESLKSNQNYDVTAALIADLPKDFLSYNVVILHQLPSNGDNLNKIKQLINSNVPLLFIIGTQTNLSLLNSMALGFSITANSQNTNQVTSLHNPDFSLFTLSKGTEDIIRDLPPLMCPVGKLNAQSTTQTLAYQKIGSVNTNYPLLSFYNTSSGKVGLIAGENIWKWRLHNYLFNHTHNEVDEIIQKSVQLVANKIDKSRFRVLCDNVFNENQPISMQAELYNENYELINDSEVSIVIKNQQNKTFNFTFGKTTNAYILNAGRFQSGHYTYLAKTTLGEQTFSVNGSFEVSEENLEQINLTADHSLLYNIAHKTSGKMFYPSNMQAIADFLKANDQIKPMIYQTIEPKRLLACWWYWLAILVLLSAEWGLRKYWGNT
ncbi:MAG: hypothetical protein LBO06_02775 [Bacteroidales bacterium]|jgi:hypothetical protein|nr:hypothetical protein [Bacteroidales bacterium]